MASISRHDYNKTKLLLEKFKNPILYVDYSGSTLLHYSVIHGNGKITKYLNEKGFNINSLNIHGSSPLMLAVENQKADCVKVLLKNNADTNIVDWKKSIAIATSIQYIMSFVFHIKKERLASDCRSAIRETKQ